MFGMIRVCCGSTGKPDPQLFILVYRLVSFYALMKPLKGSNVRGFEIFKTLLANGDHAEEVENRERFENTILASPTVGEIPETKISLPVYSSKLLVAAD